MKKPTLGMVKQIRELLSDESGIDDDWFLIHMHYELAYFDNSITIRIDNLNEQEFAWLNEES